MKITGYCFILILLVIHGCAQPILPEPDSGHQGLFAGDPYLGIVVKEIADGEGAVIQSIPPGPLLRTLKQNPVIDHGDLLLQIDNHPVTAETLSKIINRYLPGDSVVLKFGKSSRSITESTGGIKPAIVPIEIRLTLDSRQNWTGPISVTRKTGIRDDPGRITPLSTATSRLEAFYLSILAGHKLDIPINRIISFFRSWRDRSFGYHSLSRVMYPFYYPTRLVELQQKVTGTLSAITANPEVYLDHLADNLDLERPEQSQKSVTTGPGDTWDRIKKAIVMASHFVDNAFAEFDPIERGMLRDDMRYFLTELSQGRTIPEQSDPQRSIRVLRSSMRVDFQSLLSAAASLSEFMRRDLTFTDPPDVKQTSIPAAVTNAISGDVIAIEKTGQYWLVYGGKNKNRYDMSLIDMVVDAGGDDIYDYTGPMQRQVQLIIDISGNDQYLGSMTGPAAGWFGLSMLVDYAGHDTYQGTLAANGAGIMGIGVLMDYAGADNYQGNYFSNGAAVYGSGVILDLGEEADVYLSDSFSQGFAGPKGFGLIYENSGNDLYRANGSTPSSYGTPAVYRSFSQGIGFGIRGYDSGGIGIISDQDGNDRYEGGEFSQGGGYFWGLGILHDVKGNDLYYGNRYSQGFAAHQASGILADISGNDTYWGMTAASQGAAWDVATAVLIDHGGNDSYHADGLSQGAAAMQAIGWLIDMEGTDHYTAPEGSVQGHSSVNSYHYDATDPVYSWSLFIDAGGQTDVYSTKRSNNEITSFTQLNNTKPEDSRVYGLFIDSAEPLNSQGNPITQSPDSPLRVIPHYTESD